MAWMCCILSYSFRRLVPCSPGAFYCIAEAFENFIPNHWEQDPMTPCFIHSLRFQQQNRSRQSSPPHIQERWTRWHRIWLKRLCIYHKIQRESNHDSFNICTSQDQKGSKPSLLSKQDIGAKSVSNHDRSCRIYGNLFHSWRESASQWINSLRSRAFLHQRWRFPRTDWFSSSRRTQSSGYRASTWERWSLYRRMCWRRWSGNLGVVESFGDLGYVKAKSKQKGWRRQLDQMWMRWREREKNLIDATISGILKEEGVNKWAGWAER